MTRATSGEATTRLLLESTRGSREALDELIPVVYQELRRLAARYLRRERRDHTLQATALVNEAYLSLVDQTNVRWQNRAHFLAIAARTMRHILLDHARAHQAAKRGGGVTRLTFDEGLRGEAPREVDLVQLDEALARLAELDPEKARIVELRFFGGLTIEETAEALGTSASTVKRAWSVAKAWLHREVGRGG